MKEKKTMVSLGDILLLVLGIAFLLGILFVFGPCGPKEDGGWMTCHWAGQAVTGVAAVILTLALIHIFMRDKGVKMGLDLAVIPAAVLAALIPGRLIGLCMMHDMRCRAVMTPAVTVFAVLLIAAAVLDLLLQKRAK